MRLRSAVLIACLLGLTLPTHSQVNDLPIVQLEVWTELDPFAADARPVERSVAIGRLLDEAALVLSGMVYGFTFLYVPGDRDRQVDEVFDLQPVASITRGDPALRVTQTWVDGDLLFARMYYQMRDDQLGWFRGWQGASVVTSQGVGAAAFVLGPLGKPDAYTDGIREAVRAHARTQVFNRPRLITGAVTIAEPPRVWVAEGDYRAAVAVNLQIDSIEPYTTF